MELCRVTTWSKELRESQRFTNIARKWFTVSVTNTREHFRSCLKQDVLSHTFMPSTKWPCFHLHMKSHGSAEKYPEMADS
jgi:hypothetical protein